MSATVKPFRKRRAHTDAPSNDPGWGEHIAYRRHQVLRASPAELEHLVRCVADRNCAFERLLDALMPMISGTEQLSAETALQLSTALFEIEERAAAEDQLYALVNEQGAPALALSEAGQVLTLNTAAAHLFRVSSGDGLAALHIDGNEFVGFKRRLTAMPGPTLIRVLRFDGGDGAIPLLMTGSYHPRFRAFTLTALQHHWPASIDLALEELYGLTVSEREVLSCLARGMTSEQIAGQRGRAVGTVRQQVKRILQKLGASSQLEAATLAAAAATRADHDTPVRTGLLPLREQESHLQIGELMRNSRRVGWRRFGDSAGHKVLFLHGPSFGAGEYSADRDEAARHGLNVLAPERPGYGRTHSPAPGEDALECQYLDLLAVMEEQGFDQVTVLAHEVALIPGLELARRQPDRVRGVLAVSAAPPFRQLEQIQRMPDHQAIFIQAARHAPWLVRLMTRLLMVRTRQLGPESWTDVIFEGVEPDTHVITRPSLKSGVVATYSFYLNQMGRGFEVDLDLMLRDWGELFEQIACPVNLLHGRRNATTPPDTLEIFRHLYPAVCIELIDEAGLTLALSQPEAIYRRLAELAKG